MIQHHEGAIAMAELQVAQSSPTPRAPLETARLSLRPTGLDDADYA